MGMANLHIKDMQMIEIDSGRVLSDLDVQESSIELSEPSFVDESVKSKSVFDSPTISFKAQVVSPDTLQTLIDKICIPSKPTEVRFESEEIVGFKQARKHKKKRINKKWLKRYGYTPIYKTVEYVGDVVNSCVDSPLSDKEYPCSNYEYELSNIRVKKNF